jgi:predicted permease
MITDSFVLFFPLFALVAGGFLLGRLFDLSEETLVRVVTDFFFPVLVFHAFYSTDLQIGAMGRLAGASVLVSVLLLLVAAAYAYLAGLDYRGFVPPMIFPNSGFLGIPLMKLWGGLAAMNAVVVFDQVQNLLIFTVGLLIVTGGFSVWGLREMGKSPLLWAIVAGFACNLVGLRLPGMVSDTLGFIAAAAAPLAGFTLGCSLSRRRPSLSIHLLAGLFIRVVLGFLAGLAASLLLGLEGTTRTVVIVASSLPAAVFSFVLPARYGVDSELPGAVVLVSTVLGIVTMPLAFWCASLL